MIAFGVLGGRYTGPTVQVHAPTLVARLSDLADSVHTVVFLDSVMPDASMVAVIDDMVAELAATEADALAPFSAATEAVKRVEGRLVVEGIDRAGLVSIRCPEVVRREALDTAVRRMAGQLWVNPTSLVAAHGGRVRLYDEGTAPMPPGA